MSATASTESAIARVLREIKECGSLTLYQVGELFPDGQRKAVSYSTVLRWVTIGSRGLNGRVFRLTAVRAGSRWLTSAAEVERFLEARNELPEPEPDQTALAAA